MPAPSPSAWVAKAGRPGQASFPIVLKWQQSRVLGLASGTTFLFGLVWHQRSTALRLYHPLNVRPSSCTRVGRRPNTILVHVQPTAALKQHVHAALPRSLTAGPGAPLRQIWCTCFPETGATSGGAAGRHGPIELRAHRTKNWSTSVPGTPPPQRSAGFMPRWCPSRASRIELEVGVTGSPPGSTGRWAPSAPERHFSDFAAILQPNPLPSSGHV